MNENETPTVEIIPEDWKHARGCPAHYGLGDCDEVSTNEDEYGWFE